jgi:hypothetical protein
MASPLIPELFEEFKASLQVAIVHRRGGNTKTFLRLFGASSWGLGNFGKCHRITAF